MNQTKIAIIGLGYVGLPLAVEFAKKYQVTGFDIKADRVAELLAGHDSTLEVDDENLNSVLISPPGGKRQQGKESALDDDKGGNLNSVLISPPGGKRQQGKESAMDDDKGGNLNSVLISPPGGKRQQGKESAVDDDKGGNLNSVLISSSPLEKGGFRGINNGLALTTLPTDIADCNIFIVTVPTPTDKNNRPVLTPLIKASETIGKVLKKDDIVIYESTVYPGATEEDCVPVLERFSGMKFNTDFFVGYSPERINPGDKEHTVTRIKKVTSGSTPETGKKVDELYKSIIVAGTHLAPSIKVAEAAKVIENSQRDINIAFVNELAKIFSNMGIDTNDVLEAAGTKWNFLRFTPGLVGGHCIGVDPYYLAQKAQETGYNPEIILAGRRMNDGMGQWVASQIIKLLIHKGHTVKDARILVLGITFKENCPDIRNTKAIDVINELKSYGCRVDVYDPWASPEEVKKEYALDLIKVSSSSSPLQGGQGGVLAELNNKYDAIVLAVAHHQFKNIDISKLRNYHNAVIYDIKGIWPKELVDGRL